MEIKIKYFSEDYPRLNKLKKGDFIDLRVDNIKSVEFLGDTVNFSRLVADKQMKAGLDIPYSKGTIIKFGLGVAMELPEGFEAIVVPRSSTFTNWGLVLTNSMGVIDNSYSGDNDEWSAEFIAMKDGVIKRFDRVCQFRIQENQPEIKFNEVKELNNKDRGGYGTSGKN